MAIPTYHATAADVESETPLLQRDVKLNAKTLLGGAAAAAFVLGAVERVTMFRDKMRQFDWRLQDATSYDWQIDHRCPLVPYLARISAGRDGSFVDHVLVSYRPLA